MAETILYKDEAHANVLLEDSTGIGLAVQANHHVIIHGGECLLLDPGGHKVFNKVFLDVSERLHGKGTIQYIFLSHQDPDIVAATNGWLMVTDANAYVSALWLRFVPHFGIDELVESRLKPIPDEGMWLSLNGSELAVLPAHFLHSPGNFQIYDPRSKILYTGDLGASLGMAYREVADFDAHVPFMEGFHKRYIAGGAAMRAWAQMARTLDIDVIAPQHGAYFQGPAMVQRFIDWCETLRCGMDLICAEPYRVPRKS